jgi:hypothetical protein
MYKYSLRNFVEDAMFDSEIEDAAIWNQGATAK